MNIIDNPVVLISALAAIASWVGVLFSFRNSRRAGKSLQIALDQEARRTPKLALYLSEGIYKTSEKYRTYAFCLSVSNIADTPNTLFQIELRISYTNKDNACMKIRLQATPKGPTVLTNDPNSILSLPCAISSHQTLKGWVYFDFEQSHLQGSIVDRYDLIVTDAHSIETAIRPIILREYSE